MALKPVVPATAVKDDFINKAGKKTLTLPKGPRVKRLSNDEATTFKALLFGPTGSGKTYTLVGLLLLGFVVFVVSTDIGGEGLSTVKLALKKLGRADLLDNCISVVLSTYGEVETFLSNPAAIYPEIYDVDIDFLVWDGFSGFQQNLLSDEIGQMTPARGENGKEVSDARESGLQFELQDWGMVKTGTVRNLDKFLKLHNVKNGRIWHKLVTCLEGLKSVKTSDGTSYKETREPMLQGSANKLIGPAFDLILNTRIMSEGEDKKRAFKYVCVGHDTLVGAKTRGLELEPIEEGDMGKLWGKISEQLGIKRGATLDIFKEESDGTVISATDTD